MNHLKMTLCLLLFSSITTTVSAKHQQPSPASYENPERAFRCYDVGDGLMQGIWDSRDARLIERVGGHCQARGLDDGDVSQLRAEALNRRDISKVLRKARKRFPELLDNAWLITAHNVSNSGVKYVKYELLYSQISSGKQIKVKVKQNIWSGKIKRMRPVVIKTTQHYDDHAQLSSY